MKPKRLQANIFGMDLKLSALVLLFLAMWIGTHWIAISLGMGSGSDDRS